MENFKLKRKQIDDDTLINLSDFEWKLFDSALPSNKRLHIDNKNVLKQDCTNVLQAYQNCEYRAEGGVGGSRAKLQVSLVQSFVWPSECGMYHRVKYNQFHVN